MARDIAYQSVGNPIQRRRLPAGRPELVMRYLPYDRSEDAQFAFQLLQSAAVLGPAVMLVKFLATFAQGPSTFFFVNFIPGVAALYFLLRAYHEFDARWLKLPMGFVAAAALYINVPLPPLVLQFSAAGAVGGLTWLFAMHWTGYCTASPFDRSAASTLHADWQWYIAGVAVIPAVLVIVSTFVPLLALSIGMAVIVLQLAEALRSWPVQNAFRAGWHAIVSWLTYDRHDAKPPGTWRSPAGSWPERLAATGICIVAVSVLPVAVIPVGGTAITGADDGSSFRAAVATIGSALPLLPILLLLPALVTFGVPAILTLPLLSEADSRRTGRVDETNWRQLVDAIQNSNDTIEKGSLYIGRVVADATPLLVPRKVFTEHAHFLGDSGGGKTSLGHCPLIEQLGARGDCSIIVIDLKADTLELFGTLQAVAKQVHERSGRTIPVKHFTNQVGRSTYAFNLLNYPFWNNLELYTRTDILCGALGLTYGPDYGEGYYSSANAAVLYHTIKTFPHLTTYRELGDRVGYVAANAKASELHPEIRKAGVHVKTVLDRLGSFAALNAAPDNGSTDEVLREAIDFTQVFQEPQFHYFHLSTTLGPGSSPEIARLIAYSLLATATQVERKCQVFLVIDEFQRMVARNIEYMLQLARSMGVGVILANQTMQDLRTSTADLIPAIEANCRYRQWFSVSSGEDRERLIQGSGETVDYLFSETTTYTDRGENYSSTCSEHINNRLTVNDILLTSDDPFRSIVRISRGEGYAQYGGMPFVVESDYHISEDDYKKRKNTPWPDEGGGAFVPRLDDSPNNPLRPSPGPNVTTEVIGEAGTSTGNTSDPLTHFTHQSKRRQSRRDAS